MQKAELRPVFLSNKAMRRELTPNYFQSILHFWHFPPFGVTRILHIYNEIL